MGCQARKGGNNDRTGNPRNIPCNHAGLAWSTFPRPSPSPRSISLSLAQELDVLSQDGYGSNAYIPRPANIERKVAGHLRSRRSQATPSHYQASLAIIKPTFAFTKRRWNAPTKRKRQAMHLGGFACILYISSLGLDNVGLERGNVVLNQPTSTRAAGPRSMTRSPLLLLQLAILVVPP